jgi:hypothetical protein
MADYYCNSLTGDNAGAGTSGDPWETLAYAVANVADDDRIILQYASGTAYSITSLITIDGTTDRLVITGQDSGGLIFADSPGSYNRSERALITVDYAGDGIYNTSNSTITLAGLEFDGGGVGSKAYTANSTGRIVLMWGCYIHDMTSRGANVEGGSTFRETRVSSCPLGVYTLGSLCTFEACIFDNLSSSMAVDKSSTLQVHTAENCTFYRCDGVSYVIDTPATNWTITNCLFVDGKTTYGLNGSIQTTGNCYTSDGGTYHTSGNYNGATTPADDLALDPGFVDAAGGDFRVTNSTVATGGTATSVARLFDGTTMPASPPIGALTLDVGDGPWYVDADDGDNANAGNSEAAALADLTTALLFAVLNGDANQTIYVMSASAATLETSTTSLALAGLSIVAIDDRSVAADDLDGFDWTNRPTVSCNAAGGLLSISATADVTVRGIIFDGLDASAHAIQGGGADRVVNAYDCEFTGWTTAAVRVPGSGSTVERCMLRDSQVGIDAWHAIDVNACVFKDLTGHAVTKLAATTAPTFRQCLFTGCNSGGTVAVEDQGDLSDASVFLNCLWYDNPTLYGAYNQANYTACACYSSDAATYHTGGNWSGGAPSGCLEVDPLFVDAASEDYRLEALSPLAESGSATPVTRTFDRELIG